MREPIHTSEEIIDAGMQILARGKPVNGSSLRQELGGTGNVKRLRDIWEHHLKSSASPEPDVEVPEELKAIVQAASERRQQDLWTFATNTVQVMKKLLQPEIDRIRVAADEREKSLESQFEDAASIIDSLEVELAQEKQRVCDLEAEIVQLRQRDEEHKVALARLEGRLGHMDSLRGDQEAIRNELRERLEMISSVAHELAALKVATPGATTPGGP